MKQAKVIKLVTGDTLLAMVNNNYHVDSDLQDFVDLDYPIEVVSQYTDLGERMSERFSLKPWQSMVQTHSITIDTSTIMFCENMKDEFMQGYSETVEYFYLGGAEKEERELEMEQNLLLQQSTIDDTTVH